MARNCKISNPKLDELKVSLTELKTNLVNGTISDSEFEVLLNLLKLKYCGLGGQVTEVQFNQALNSLLVDDSYIEQPETSQAKQLVNISLDYDKMSELYKNATNALGNMKHMFTSLMFRSMYVDNVDYGDLTDSSGRLLNDTIKRIPTTRQEVNAKIAQLKNSLINLVADKLGIESRPVFSYLNKKIDAQAYQDFLNNDKIQAFLSIINENLQTASSDLLETHSALFILNNFDKLVLEYLDKIITIAPDKVGLLNNFEYIQSLEGNAPSYWSADDLSTYGSDLYASNLGKFILGTIPKVNSELHEIPGAFMSSQDSFVIGALLRKAETEYHILARELPDYDENLSFRTNLKKAVKTLLDLGINSDILPSLNRFRKELYPLYKFLYKDGEGTLGYRDIFYKTARSGRIANINSILNLEDVLCAEVIKNAAPVLLEYSTFDRLKVGESPIRTINLAHSFRGNSYITDNLKLRVFDQLRVDYSDRPMLMKGAFPASIYRNKTIQDFLYDKSQEMLEFKKVFKMFFNEDLSDQLFYSLPSVDPERNKENIILIVFKIISLADSAQGLEISDKIVDFTKNFLKFFIDKIGEYRNAYTGLILTIADRKVDMPLTVIRNSEGKAYPIYRLNSTILETSYLTRVYKPTRLNRANLNLFVGNPHLLSNINNPERQAGQELSINKGYPGSIGLRLETISKNKVNPANDSSAEEVYINSFLGDFLGLGVAENGHSVGTQLMTYSDKASIFDLIVNLQATIYRYGNKEINKSLDLMGNLDIFDLYYFYSKNQYVDLIYNILETWQELLDLDFTLPDKNAEFMNTGDMLQETITSIDNAWKIVRDEISSWNKNTLGKSVLEYLEDLVRERTDLWNADFELTKELHYSVYQKGKITLNKSIYNRYNQLKTKKLQKDVLEKVVDKNLSSDWFKTMLSIVRTNGVGSTLVLKYCEFHGFPYSAEDPISRDLMFRKIVLNNLIRTQALDLHFKGVYLDTIKGLPDYDEFTDVENSIIEADKRFKAAGKRTVDLPGTKENFALNLIDGVSIEALFAHIEEPQEKVFNPAGQEDDIEILNGSARISPILSRMESASLAGKPLRGDAHKSLGEGVHDFYSTLYKWAAFNTTSWLIRNSQRSAYSMEVLFKKMHDIPFLEDIDLTKTFLSSKHYTPSMANNGKKVYFAYGVHYYQIIDLIKTGYNTYNLKLKEVDAQGNELEELYFPLAISENVHIQSLYDLYKTFGGAESMLLSPETGNLEYSDDIFDILYNYTVNIGEIVAGGVIDQTTVRLPLRNKFIACAASDSALKRGVTNRNSKRVYTRTGDSLITSKVKTALFGIQMDAFHHIDDESLATEPTQTLAALATNGNTMEEAQRVYNAIATIIQENIKSISNRFGYFVDTENLSQVIKLLSVEISKLCETQGTDLQLSIIDLCDLYLNDLVPVSELAFYNAFHMWSIIDLNQLALRRKYTGLGGVLNPSANIYLLFNIDGKDYLYDDLARLARTEFSDFEETLMEFSTEELVNLLIYSRTTFGSRNLNLMLQQANESTIPQLLQIANAIQANLLVPDGEVDEVLHRYVGVRIQKGLIDPLDTVIYKKGNKWYKKLMRDSDSYFGLLLDPEITETYLDISIPHDLKPQIVKYEFNGEEHSLYDSAAGELSYMFQQFDYSNMDELITEIVEDNDTNEQKCNQL